MFYFFSKRNRTKRKFYFPQTPFYIKGLKKFFAETVEKFMFW